MFVRKIRGQNKFGNIILTRAQVELVKKAGIPIELYIEKMMDLIAKQRRWKWYFERKKAK